MFILDRIVHEKKLLKMAIGWSIKKQRRKTIKLRKTQDRTAVPSNLSKWQILLVIVTKNIRVKEINAYSDDGGISRMIDQMISDIDQLDRFDPDRQI
jgi:hypothetical protein